MKYVLLILMTVFLACNEKVAPPVPTVKQDTLAVCDTIKNVKIKYLDSVTIKADENPIIIRCGKVVKDSLGYRFVYIDGYRIITSSGKDIDYKDVISTTEKQK